jgi:hypothetical protein
MRRGGGGESDDGHAGEQGLDLPQLPVRGSAQ